MGAVPSILAKPADMIPLEIQSIKRRIALWDKNSIGQNRASSHQSNFGLSPSRIRGNRPNRPANWKPCFVLYYRQSYTQYALTLLNLKTVQKMMERKCARHAKMAASININGHHY